MSSDIRKNINTIVNEESRDFEYDRIVSRRNPETYVNYEYTYGEKEDGSLIPQDLDTMMLHKFRGGSEKLDSYDVSKIIKRFPSWDTDFWTYKNKPFVNFYSVQEKESFKEYCRQIGVVFDEVGKDDNEKLKPYKQSISYHPSVFNKQKNSQKIDDEFF